MKKIVAVVVIILAVAGFSAPFINGLVMEKIIRQTQDDLNEMYASAGSGVSVRITDYDRGFLSSEIEWEIRLGGLAAVYGIDEILFVDRADHRLTGVVSRTSLERNKWFTDLISNKLHGKNPLHITTAYRLTGEIESIIDVDAFSLQAENETADFHPAKIITEIEEGFEHLECEATWEGVSAGVKAGIEGFALEAELERISTYIWDGEIEYSIDRIKLDDPQAAFDLKNFRGEYALDFNREKNTLSIGGEVAFADLAGEKENIKDAYFRLDVHNLDAKGYGEFMELYTRTVQSVMDDIVRTQEDPAMMEKVVKERITAASLQMMAAYEKLLKKDLQIRIADMHALLPAGKVNGSLALQLNRDITFAQLASIATQPGMAFEMLSLQSHLSLPAELTGNNYLQLISPVYEGMQTGLFVLNGENLVHDAETRDGKLYLNGLEVVLK